MNLNMNWIEKIVFIFFDTISKKRRFDFRFDVDFAADFLIVDSTKKIIDSSILSIWMKNKNSDVISEKIKTSEKIESRWFNDFDKKTAFALFINTNFVLFVDINFSFSKSNRFSWTFALFAWMMQIDLFFFFRFLTGEAERSKTALLAEGERPYAQGRWRDNCWLKTISLRSYELYDSSKRNSFLAWKFFFSKTLFNSFFFSKKFFFFSNFVICYDFVSFHYDCLSVFVFC